MSDLVWLIFPPSTSLPFPNHAKQGICESGEKFPILASSDPSRTEYVCRGGEIVIELTHGEIELLLDYREFKGLVDEVWKANE